MDIRLARRMETQKASEIRELLKITARPEVISLAGGLPAPELFPVEELKAVSRRVLEDAGQSALQYSTTEGHPPLRAWIAHRMAERMGARVQPEEILITTGSQQALDLTGKLFLDEGDAVICESPTYIGAINAFRAYQPRFLEVPTDDDGMVIPELERRLAQTDRVRFIYVVPDFQNPSGRCWTLERRQQLMDLVRRHRIPVVEDCPYTEIRFEGSNVPSLKSMDQDDLVIQLGTFSKIFCPGYRVGWVAAARPLIDKYNLLKQGADLHTSTMAQMEIATYLSMFDLDANLRRIREVYRSRRAAMIHALERELPPQVRFTRPQGGLFLWVELPERLNARELLSRCLEQNVAFVPGGSFFPNGGHENTMRLNFSNMPEDRIDEGVRRIGKVLRELLPAARAAEVHA
jgi:2-aminoadipate transaminase